MTALKAKEQTFSTATSLEGMEMIFRITYEGRGGQEIAEIDADSELEACRAFHWSRDEEPTWIVAVESPGARGMKCRPFHSYIIA